MISGKKYIFGFASALGDVGLPEDNIPMALFLFNAGVELGQLIFVFLMLVLLAGIRRLRLPAPSSAHQFPAYGIGTLAMYWFVERVVTTWLQ